MKKYIIKYGFSLAFALVVFGAPKNSYALFPTLDITSIFERVKGTVQTIKSYTKVKEATELASDINNAVGDASKSIGELGVDEVKKAKEKKDKFDKWKQRYDKLQDKVKERKEQFEKQKKEFEEAKDRAEKFKADVNKFKSDYDSTMADIDNFKSDVDAAKSKVDGYKDQANTILGNSGDDESNNGEKTLSPSTPDSSSSTASPVASASPSSVVSDIQRQPFAVSNEVVDSSIADSELIDDSEYLLSEEELKQKEEEEQKPEEAKESEKAKEEAPTPEEAAKLALEEEEARLKLLRESQGEDYSLSAGEKSLEEAKKRAEELEKMRGNTDSSISSGAAATEEAKKRVEEIQRLKNNSSRRKPFGRTSYRNSERLAFADVTDKATDGPSGTTEDGVFVITEEAAIYCDINVNNDLGEDSTKMKDCTVKMLTEMSSDHASAAADGRAKYREILRGQIIDTLAAIMDTNSEAAQFNTAVMEPLSEDIGGAANTRDDVSALSLTNKETVYVINKLTYSSSLQLFLDAFRQLGYFDVKDMEEGASASGSGLSAGDDGKSEGTTGATQ